MAASSQGVTVVVLLADPDAPTEIAQRMARMLPDRLADKSGQGRRFDVKVVSEPFTAGTEDPRTLMHRVIDRGSAENWDIVVALTDLPLHAHQRKLVVDLKSRTRRGATVPSVIGGLAAAEKGPAGRGRSRTQLGGPTGPRG